MREIIEELKAINQQITEKKFHVSAHLINSIQQYLDNHQQDLGLKNSQVYFQSFVQYLKSNIITSFNDNQLAKEIMQMETALKEMIALNNQYLSPLNKNHASQMDAFFELEKNNFANNDFSLKSLEESTHRLRHLLEKIDNKNIDNQLLELAKHFAKTISLGIKSLLNNPENIPAFVQSSLALIKSGYQLLTKLVMNLIAKIGNAELTHFVNEIFDEGQQYIENIFIQGAQGLFNQFNYQKTLDNVECNPEAKPSPQPKC